MTSVWKGAAPLLLASTSATRRLLLESAALPVETRAPEVDERAIEAAAADLTPPALAARLYAINTIAPALLTAALAAQPGLAEGTVVNLLDQKLANPNPDFFSYTLSK